MEQTFEVDIDIVRLRYFMSRAGGRVFSENEIRQWLTEIGFVNTQEGWIAKESTLRNLNIQSVRSLRRIA